MIKLFLSAFTWLLFSSTLFAQVTTLNLEQMPGEMTQGSEDFWQWINEIYQDGAVLYPELHLEFNLDENFENAREFISYQIITKEGNSVEVFWVKETEDHPLEAGQHTRVVQVPAFEEDPAARFFVRVAIIETSEDQMSFKSVQYFAVSPLKKGGLGILVGNGSSGDQLFGEAQSFEPNADNQDVGGCGVVGNSRSSGNFWVLVLICIALLLVTRFEKSRF